MANNFERKKIVYISGGITHNPNFVSEFNEAEKFLTEKGYIVINPAKVGLALPEMDWGIYMQIDLLLLAKADMIYMLRGWGQSVGASVEKAFADSAKKPILFQEE